MSGEGDENKDTPGNHAESETASQGGSSDPQLPPAIATPNPPPSPDSTPTPKEKTYERRENAKLFLEAIGVVLLLVYTVFTALQWSQIRWTNRQTAQALKGSGDALSQTLIKMQGQIDATGRQADRTKDLADKMEDSVKQATRLANATEIANANSLVADRPWLAITITITDFGSDKTPMKDVTIINSGKRPALITNFSMGGEHFNNMVENPPYEKQVEMRQLLVPGTHYDSVVKLFKGGILTAPAFAEFDAGRANFFSYAKVEYTDIGTGKTYYTHTCVQYRPATAETSAQFISCIAYNYGD